LLNNFIEYLSDSSNNIIGGGKMAGITTQKVKELTEKGESVVQVAQKYKLTREAIYCHL